MLFPSRPETMPGRREDYPDRPAYARRGSSSRSKEKVASRHHLLQEPFAREGGAGPLRADGIAE